MSGGGEISGGWTEVFRWTQAGGMIGLGIPPGLPALTAAGMSADGAVIAADWGEPFYWTQSGGWVGIGDLPGGKFNADVRGISADGLVIVGRGTSASGYEAYRWTEAGGMVGLGVLPGSTSFDSRAYGVSADGSFVVGRARGASGNEPFRWTQSEGMISLANFSAIPREVSADGSIIVGEMFIVGEGNLAFIWTPNGGVVPLADLLIGQGDDLSHWTRLTDSSGISNDGRTIVGNGININGDSEAFLATLVGDVATVVPDSFSVTRGSYISGGTLELAESDNADVSIQRATSDIQSRTEFEVKAVSPNATPSSLEVALEGAVFARSTVNQTIELFDYAAGVWEQVDTRAATRFTDSTVTVNATGDLSRFVEAGTMCIQARIRYQSPIARQQFSSNTDQFIWTIGQ